MIIGILVAAVLVVGVVAAVVMRGRSSSGHLEVEESVSSAERIEGFSREPSLQARLDHAGDGAAEATPTPSPSVPETPEAGTDSQPEPEPEVEVAPAPEAPAAKASEVAEPAEVEATAEDAASDAPAAAPAAPGEERVDRFAPRGRRATGPVDIKWPTNTPTAKPAEPEPVVADDTVEDADDEAGKVAEPEPVVAEDATDADDEPEAEPVPVASEDEPPAEDDADAAEEVEPEPAVAESEPEPELTEDEDEAGGDPADEPEPLVAEAEASHDEDERSAEGSDEPPEGDDEVVIDLAAEERTHEVVDEPDPVDQVLQSLIRRAHQRHVGVAEVAAELVEQAALEDREVDEVLADLVQRDTGQDHEELTLFSASVPTRPGQLSQFERLASSEKKRVIVRVLCLLVADAERSASRTEERDDEPEAQASSWPLARAVWPSGDDEADEDDDLPELPARRLTPSQR